MRLPHAPTSPWCAHTSAPDEAPFLIQLGRDVHNGGGEWGGEMGGVSHCLLWVPK